MLDIYEEYVDRLAHDLFRVNVSRTTGVLCLVRGIEQTTEIEQHSSSEAVLKGASAPRITDRLGQEIYASINKCPAQQRRARGEGETKYVSMAIRKTGASIIFLLDYVGGLGIVRKLSLLSRGTKERSGAE
jgi:hypothetical protein